MKAAITLVALTILTSAEAFAKDRIVDCSITSLPGNEVQFSGKCRFSSEKDGSFTLMDAKGGDLLYERISLVHVFLTGKGSAEVSGLVLDEGGGGHNSRWGAAERSKKDAACWEGSDFRICAW